MHRIGFYALFIPLWLITLLPLRVLYLFSDSCFLVLYYIAGYRKKVVFTNLKNSFPDMDDAGIKKIARSFYRHLCDYFIEALYGLNISIREMKKRYVFKNIELIEGLLVKNRGVICVCGHYGNWEWLSYFQLYLKDPFMAIYRPLRNKAVDELLIRIRGRFKARLLPMARAPKELMAYARNNIPNLTVFLSDQRPIWSSANYWTTFLNQETPVLLGTEALARKLNYCVVFADIQKVGRGHYQILFTLITDNPRTTSEFEITEAHTRLLEKVIRKKPDYWLWSHKRWKHVREEIEKKQKNA